MYFISTDGMTHETAPKGNVLCKYLEPSFGYYSVEYAMGYYDKGNGWTHWVTNNKIKVIAYCILPKPSESIKISQKDFQKKYNSHFPNNGCISNKMLEEISQND